LSLASERGIVDVIDDLVGMCAEGECPLMHAESYHEQFAEILWSTYSHMKHFVIDRKVFLFNPLSKKGLMCVGTAMFPCEEVFGCSGIDLARLPEVLSQLGYGLTRDVGSSRTLVVSVMIGGIVKLFKFFIALPIGGAKRGTVVTTQVEGKGKYKVKSFNGLIKAIGKELKPLSRELKTKVKSDISEKIHGLGLYHGKGVYRRKMTPVRGQGLYEDGYEGVSNNLIVGNGKRHARNSPIRFLSVGDETDTLVVEGTDYCGDIYGAGLSSDGIFYPFDRNDFPINPGMRRLFPRVSQIAANFDEWCLDQLIVYFDSTIQQQATTGNGQTGTVVAATQYNPAAPKFTDKTSMLEYTHSSSAAMTQNMEHGVECDPRKSNGSWFSVRTGPVPSNEDSKTYDKGVFQIALCDVPSQFNGYQIGELFVYYRLRLRKFKLFVNRGLNCLMDKFVVKGGTTNNPFSDIGTNGFLLSRKLNSIGVGITYSSNTTKIIFPDWLNGYFRINLTSYSFTTATTFLALVSGVATAGNVIQIWDMNVLAGGAPTIYVNSPHQLTTVTQGAATDHRFNFTCDVFVRPSSAGIDNALTLTFNTQAVNFYNSALEIFQMQSDNFSSSSDRTVYIDSLGNTVSL